MLNHLKNLTKPGETLSPADSDASANFGASIFYAVTLALVALLVWFVRGHADPEDVMFVASQSVRVVLMGILASAVKYAVAVSLGAFAFQVVENSRMGVRIGEKHFLLLTFVLGACLVFGGR